MRPRTARPNPLQQELSFNLDELKQKVAQKKFVQKHAPEVVAQRVAQAKLLRAEHAKRWITKRYLQGESVEGLAKQWKMSPQTMDLLIQEIHKKDSGAQTRRENAVHERLLNEKRARWARERKQKLIKKNKSSQRTPIIPGLGVTPTKAPQKQVGAGGAVKRVTQDSPMLKNFAPLQTQTYRADELLRHIGMGEDKKSADYRAKQIAVNMLLQKAQPASLEEIYTHLTGEARLALTRHEAGKILQELQLVGAIKKQRGTNIFLIDPYWIGKA
ncbi:MAG: hypothetical protein WCW44_04665 [archaeon]